MTTETITVGPRMLDLRLYAGDGFAMQFAFVDKSTGGSWAAAGVWAAEVRSPITAAEPLVVFTIDTTQQAAGRIGISLTGEQVRLLLGTKDASWDLQQIAPDAQPRTWYRGKISASQDVTRV